MVKSEQIYSPQSYLCGVIGTCYFLKYHKHPIDEIQDILVSEGVELWDYPLTEIEHIVENNLDVVDTYDLTEIMSSIFNKYKELTNDL